MPHDASHGAPDAALSAVLVMPSFGSGGAERVILNLAAGLVAAGVTTRLLVLDPRGPLADAVPAGVAVVDLGHRRARSAGPALLRAVRRYAPDVVIGSQTHLNVLLGLLRPLFPPATQLVLRAPAFAEGPTGAGGRLLGRVLGRADLVIATSEPMRAGLAAVLRGRARLTTLPNPVDVAGLRAAVAPGTRPSPTRLLTLGRLVEGKGLTDLLDALAASPDPHLTLAIVGDGPLRAALVAHAQALGIADRVELLGHVADRAQLATLVAGARALVHPSLAEGLPNAVLEALALGTPVLATTDLAVLAGLAQELGEGALCLVPRTQLADALAQQAAAGEQAPRPCLLPDRFRREQVVVDLIALAGAGLQQAGQRTDQQRDR